MRTVTPNAPISLAELRQLATVRFGDLVKAVVDIERETMVLSAALHSDEEAELLSAGSRQADLWGINLYPDVTGPEWIEFDSLINLRPSVGNRSRGVDDPATRESIVALVNRMVRR